MGSGLKLLPADTSTSEWTGKRSDPILAQNQPKKAKMPRRFFLQRALEARTESPSRSVLLLVSPSTHYRKVSRQQADLNLQ